MTTKRIIIAVERLLNLHSKFDKIKKKKNQQKRLKEVKCPFTAELRSKGTFHSPQGTYSE